MGQLLIDIIGVSLSEPHTSGTALGMCVNVHACLLVAIYCKFFVNERIQMFHEDRSRA